MEGVGGRVGTVERSGAEGVMAWGKGCWVDWTVVDWHSEGVSGKSIFARISL